MKIGKITFGLTEVVTLATALCVVLLQTQLYLAGYRLVPDDIYSHYLALQGLDAVMEHAHTAATLQGRIGMYVLLPINALASYLADHLAFRVLFVVLHFGTMYLAAFFVALLLRRNIQLFMFLVLVILHPLDFYHLPPNSYALQNSAPLVVIFLARIWLWRQWEARSSPHWFGLCVACVVFSAAMLHSEFSIALGAVLLVAEHLSLLIRNLQSNRSIPAAIVRQLASRRFWYDTISLSATLFIYVLFRQLNPSEYDGNSPDGFSKMGDTWATLYGHIAEGTIFTRLDNLALLNTMSGSTLLMALFVGVLTFLFFLTVKKPPLGPLEMASTVAVSAFAAALMTLPIAGVIKYQDRCLNGHGCAYLDSRMSFYAVGAAVAALCLWALSVPKSKSRRRLMTMVLSLVLAVLSSSTYLVNRLKEGEMEAIVSGWDRASAITCVEAPTWADEETLARLIDPETKITLSHTIDDYWQLYLEHRKGQLDCNDLPWSVERWLPHMNAHFVELDQTLSFALYQHGMSLESGWNGAEPWGVWSSDNVAQISIKPTDPEIRSLGFRFHLYPPTTFTDFHQSIGVVINDRKYADWSLEPDECGARVIQLDSPLPADRETRISFEVAKPTSPKSIGINEDTRRLGIGLISMTAGDWSEDEVSAWKDRQCR